MGVADNTIVLKPNLNRSTLVKYRFKINGTCGKFAEFTETNLRRNRASDIIISHAFNRSVKEK